MSGINKVIIVGVLGNDPVTRNFGTNERVTTISVVTYEQCTSKLTGRTVKVREWHKVSLFGCLSKLASEQLKQGSKVYIEGSVNTRRWFDKNGQINYRANIRAHLIEILGVRSSIPKQSTKSSLKNNSMSLTVSKLPAPSVNSDPVYSDDIPF